MVVEFAIIAIDHFRRIIPKYVQRLLDQVTLLAAGEAIVFGSALHVPARVQIKLPKREPWSATAAPYVDWATAEAFPLAYVIENWGLINTAEHNDTATQPAVASPVSTVNALNQEPDDEIPF